MSSSVGLRGFEPRLALPAVLNRTIIEDLMDNRRIEQHVNLLLPSVHSNFNSIPCASGSFRDQLTVTVWRRM